MRKILFSSLLIFSFIVNQSLAHDYINFANFKNAEIVKWASKDGQKRFKKSKYKNDFIQLAPNYQPQINPLYCGIASSVIILNSIYSENQRPNQEALATKFPNEIGNGMVEFPLYSQLTFLNKDTDKIKKREIIDFKQKNAKDQYDPGLTLAELKTLLEYYKLKAELTYIDNKPTDADFDNFRKRLKDILSDEQNYIIVNFSGKSYGATTAGHITPIAAYDQKSDSVLLLDVAAHKNPWYWVRLDLLYQAMNTKDGDNYRGYLIVSKS